MIEPEIAFGDLEDCMEVVECYIKFLVKYCLDNLADDIEFFANRQGGQKDLKEYLIRLKKKLLLYFCLKLMIPD